MADTIGHVHDHAQQYSTVHKPHACRWHATVASNAAATAVISRQCIKAQQEAGTLVLQIMLPASSVGDAALLTQQPCRHQDWLWCKTMQQDLHGTDMQLQPVHQNIS